MSLSQRGPASQRNEAPPSPCAASVAGRILGSLARDAMKLITFGITFGITLLVVSNFSGFASYGRRMENQYEDNRATTDKAADRSHKAH